MAWGHRYADATLGSGSLKAVVALPEGEDLNEWLAANSACALCLLASGFVADFLERAAVDFFNQINMVCGGPPPLSALALRMLTGRFVLLFAALWHRV